MSTPDDQIQPTELHARDAEALEALIAADFDPMRVEEKDRERAVRVARLLGLLDLPTPASDPSLVDVICAKAGQAGGLGSHADMGAALVPDDEEALDAWVRGEYDLSRVPASLRARASKHETIAQLIGSVDAWDAGDLTQRTLDVVQDEIEGAESRLVIPSSRSRLRLADIVSVAAMLFIAGSILVPVMSGMRTAAQRESCNANLGNVALAMDQYATTHRNQVPMATAGFGGSPWWNVDRSRPQSNSANLYTLAKTGYTSLESLACPGNRFAETSAVSTRAVDWSSLQGISYSYRVMVGEDRPEWGDSRFVVMADRSPVILRAVKKDPIRADEDSPNHSHRGQHILWSDGSSEWSDSPTLENGDNIWLPRPIERVLREAGKQTGRQFLTGTETPEDVRDAFVGP